VKYKTPDITKPENWANVEAAVAKVFEGRLDMPLLRAERTVIPEHQVVRARLLTDDFSPVEFLDAMKTNNTAER
jgi:spermidine synthase